MITLPILFIILGGYIAAKLRFFESSATDFLVRLLFYIIMPITLFFDVYQLPIAEILVWDYMGAYFLASISIMIVSTILSRCIFKRDIPNLIINAMGATHTNTAYLALPLFLMLFKTVAPVASIIIVQTLFNFLILFGLDISTNRLGRKLGYSTACLIILENPILLGTLLGLVFSYFHFSLPTVMSSICKVVSESASFIALFALGLSLEMTQVGRNKSQQFEISLIILLKCFLHPLVAFFIGYYLLDLSGFLLKALILMAAMPSAKNMFVFAKRYEVGVGRANLIVLLTTIVSIVTINVMLLLP